MQSLAVVLEQPERLDLKVLELTAPSAHDVVVETRWSGISTGTERLFWTGRMPPFPGMGYPLVPGYEAVGDVVAAGALSGRRIGDRVFVPGASCYGEIRGLFGASSQRIVCPGTRVATIDPALEERGALLALAATAHHAIVHADGSCRFPDLIVGHGVVGRLLARLTVALGGPAPVVWESSAERRAGSFPYPVIASDEDARRNYQSIYDASGDPELLDDLIGRLAKGGEVVLAGFYDERLGFDFVRAFLKEARLRVSAEWQPADLAAVARMASNGALDLTGLVSHVVGARRASDAYRTAFEDRACLKLILDWRTTQ